MVNHKTIPAVVLATMTLISVSSTRPAEAQARSDQYLCMTQHSGGVSYDQKAKTWQSARFKPEAKYILRRLKGEEKQNKYPSDNPSNGSTQLGVQAGDPSKSEWGFFKFADRVPLATCDASFNCTSSPSLHLGSDLQRFELHWVSTYTVQTSDWYKKNQNQIGDDDSVVNLGECSLF